MVTPVTLVVKVRHEAPVDELIRRFPSFAPLQYARIEPQDHRRWSRHDGASYSHDVQVVFLGKGGYGKSSIVNAMAGRKLMKTSDVAACTRVVQSVEYELRPGHYLSFADLPGLGESQIRDDEYLEMYRNIVRKSDVVVYLVRADNRDFGIDQRAFDGLFQQNGQREKVIVVINGCDKIEPIHRQAGREPTSLQQENIERKIGDLRGVFPGIEHIVPCSAETGWNLEVLTQTIMGVLARSNGVTL